MIVAIINLVAAAVMTGVIWFVQVVHYPLFSGIGSGESTTYAVENQRRTSLVVGPPMVIEGIATIWLFVAPPTGLTRLLPLVSGLLLAVVLVSTVLLQVPRHARLASSDDAAVVSSTVTDLVRSNWIRTVGWSARTVVAAAMVVML